MSLKGVGLFSSVGIYTIRRLRYEHVCSHCAQEVNIDWRCVELNCSSPTLTLTCTYSHTHAHTHTHTHTHTPYTHAHTHTCTHTHNMHIQTHIHITHTHTQTYTHTHMRAHTHTHTYTHMHTHTHDRSMTASRQCEAIFDLEIKQEVSESGMQYFRSHSLGSLQYTCSIIINAAQAYI